MRIQTSVGLVSVSFFSVMHCSRPLQIIITFYAQGALNLVLFYYSWALKLSPSKGSKLEWIDNLLDEFLIGSAAAGYALSIAAFTQLNSITIYHLYLCYTFLSALSTVGRHFRGLIFCPRKPFDRILGLYFLGNQLLLVAVNCLTIYRLNSAWHDAPGKCFIVWVDGNGDLEERDDAVLWLYMDLIWGVLNRLVPSLMGWSGASELMGPQDPNAKLILTILFARIPCTFFFIWNMHWTIKLTLSNQVLIDDNEYSFGFGQVGALVTLCLSLCRALISYQGARRIFWLGRTNSHQYFLEHKRQQTTPDGKQSGDANLA